MGNGRYARALPYPDWLHFNAVQRTHDEHLLRMSYTLPLTLGFGLFYPRVAALGGLVSLGSMIAYDMYMVRDNHFDVKCPE